MRFRFALSGLEAEVFAFLDAGFAGDRMTLSPPERQWRHRGHGAWFATHGVFAPFRAVLLQRFLSLSLYLPRAAELNLPNALKSIANYRS